MPAAPTVSKHLIEELREKLGRVDDLEDAIRQIEEDQTGIMRSVEDRVAARMATFQRDSYDPRNGRWRGSSWATEDQARAFGLFAMSRTAELGTGIRERCSDALRSEFPGVHEHAMASDPISSGGALIPTEFSSRLLKLAEQYGVFESNAFIMPMQSADLQFVRWKGGPTVYLLSENAAGTESATTLANIYLTSKEWGTLTFYPRTLNEDSAIEIGTLLAEDIARAFAEKTDRIGFNGDGGATYFGITGVRSRLASVNGIDDGGGLVLGSGNAWSELTMTDHDNVMGILPQYADANGSAEWYCSRAYFFKVFTRLMHTAGGLTAAEVEGRRRLMFNGAPVNISQVFPSAEANSQIPAIYGNLRMAATVGRRREMSIDQDASYKFAERQITVLGVARKAISVHDVGTATEAGPVVGLITAAS